MAIVGAPFDDAVSHRSGARFGPRAIRQAQYTSGSINSLQLGVEPFEVLDVVDAGDANVVPAALDRAHAMIYRKVREVAETGAIPIVLGGDHSITWPSATAIAEVRRPGSIGIVHFDAHADTANDDWGVLAGHGTPMRRLIESGAVKGSNFVQVGLRGYWPPVDVFEWMQANGLRYHLMREIEDRGSEAVIADAIAEALDGPDSIYLSIDIDVIDPGLAPGTGTPEPGGMLTREVLRAIRQIVGAVDLCGMDIVEVSPPYDHAETTAMAANRAALEAISALALKKRGGRTGPLGAGGRVSEPSAPSRPGAAPGGQARRPSRRPSPGCTTSTWPRIPATTWRCTSPWPSGPAARSSSSRPGRAGSSGRWPPPGTRSRAVDLDPAMLARLHAQASVNVTAVLADLTTWRPPRPVFRLAILGLNSLFLMAERHQQRAALESLGRGARPGRAGRRRHLAAGRGRPGPLRPAPPARLHPDRPGQRPDRDQDRRRPPRRRNGHRPAHVDLRRGLPGRPVTPLDPA